MLWKTFFSCRVHYKITKKNKIKSFIEIQSEAQTQISQQPKVKFSNFNQKPKHKFFNNLAQQNYVQKLFKKIPHISKIVVTKLLPPRFAMSVLTKWVFLWQNKHRNVVGLQECHDGLTFVSLWYGAPPTHIWDDFQRQWRWLDPMPITATPQPPPLCAIKREERGEGGGGCYKERIVEVHTWFGMENVLQENKI